MKKCFENTIHKSFYSKYLSNNYIISTYNNLNLKFNHKHISSILKYTRKSFSEKAKPRVFYKKVFIEEFSNLPKEEILPMTKHIKNINNTEISEYLKDNFCFVINKNNISDGKYYKIKLDNKILKTRQLKDMNVYNLPLATAIADEWLSQKNFINHYEMHFNTFYSSGKLLETDEDKYEESVNRVLSYFYTDQIVYLSNNELKKISNHFNLNLIDKINSINEFFSSKFGFELDLKELNNEEIQSTVAKIDVSFEKALQLNKLKTIVSQFNPFVLCILEEAASLTKSFSVSLSLLAGLIDHNEAYLLSHAEEMYQMIENGEVEGHHDILSLAIKSKLSSIKLFYDFLTIKQ